MKRKIKDSNDFFGYLISIKNKDNNVVLGRISKDYGDSAIDDFIDYINELEEMKYIKINSLEDIHIVKSKSKLLTPNLFFFDFSFFPLYIRDNDIDIFQYVIVFYSR